MTSNDTTLVKTPLSWLNYFDGKFLRAADFFVEQRGFRELVAHSNLADGFGVVWGYDADVCGNLLRVGQGLAIDAKGRVLLLPCATAVPIDELIARSQSTTEAAPASPSSGATASFADCVEVEVDVPHQTPEGEQLWLITVAHGELACGTENVYGQLCASACSFEIERPYLHETVVLRAQALALDEPYPQSNAVSLGARHLRSRVASAYFAVERRTPPHAISAAGLADELWCRGAELAEGEVALGILCRRGSSNLWFDAWTARRERIDEPPRHYWDHRKALRPDREFLAQVLQFQCQLAELIDQFPPPPQPCADERGALVSARTTLDGLLARWAEASDEEHEKLGAGSLVQLQKLAQAIGKAAHAPRLALADAARVLIELGIVELPPAGYLPVDADSELSVNTQIRRLLGEGVDPVFCVIRPDDAALHVLGAQHDDRISLLHGLDHPDERVPIDILVPDGEFVVEREQPSSFGFRVRVGSGVESPSALGPAELLAALREATSVWMRGAGRLTTRDGVRFCLAAEGGDDEQVAALWLDLRLDADPFEVEVGASVPLHYELRGAPSGESWIVGDLTVVARDHASIGTVLRGQLLATQKFGLVGGMVRYEVEALARIEGESRQLLFELRAADEPDASNHKVIITYDTNTLDIKAAWIRTVVRDSKWFFQVHDHQRDEAVGDPGDPDHQAARAALEQIATAIDDPSFAVAGEAALFPVIEPSEPKIEIRAKHDWVVFHARHRRECAPPIPVEVVEPNRVYRVYVVKANSLTLAGKYQQALLQQSPGQLEIEEVGDVEFAPGVAKLETSAAALAALWRPHGEKRLLAWIGIAFTGAPVAEGGAIAEGRALAVDRVIDDISPAADGKGVTVRAGIPPAFAAPGVDGVIVLLTVPAAICHSVYWILPQVSHDRAVELIEAGEWEDLFGDDEDGPLAQHLADVDFVDGSLAAGQEQLLADAADAQMGAIISSYMTRPIDELVTTVVADGGHASLAVVDHARELQRIVTRTSLPQTSVFSVERNPRACGLATFIFPRGRNLAIFAVSQQYENYFSNVAPGAHLFGIPSILKQTEAKLIADVTMLDTSDKVLSLRAYNQDPALPIRSKSVTFNPGGHWRETQVRTAIARVCDVPADLSVSNYSGDASSDDVTIVVFTAD